MSATKRAAAALVLAAGLAALTAPAASAAPASHSGLPGPGFYGCAWQLPNGRWVVDPACAAWGLRLRIQW